MGLEHTTLMIRSEFKNIINEEQIALNYQEFIKIILDVIDHAYLDAFINVDEDSTSRGNPKQNEFLSSVSKIRLTGA